ncbi:hypothetical protein KKI23_03875 [Patescibacteria group bacterium]|nr:hypothetical protein [Patescibacteria group bacterium]
MTDIEKFGDDYAPFIRQRVSKLPQVAGTFVLADKAREIIYIGFGTKVSAILMEILDRGGFCLESAKYFQMAMHPSPLQGAANLFMGYKEQHGGLIPRCNKFDLSLNRM